MAFFVLKVGIETGKVQIFKIQSGYLDYVLYKTPGCFIVFVISAIKMVGGSFETSTC